MHRIVIYIVFLSLVFISNIFGQNDQYFEAIGQAKNCTYRVEDKNGGFLGTAFCIDTSGYFLTCAHVVEWDRVNHHSFDTVYLRNNIRLRKVDTADTLEGWYTMICKAAVLHVINAVDLSILKIDLTGTKVKKFSSNVIFKIR
jgi:hypothetical protein